MKSSTQNIIEGKWNELKGKAQQKWAKLKDDDIEAIKGNRTELLGRIQKNYGLTQADAEKEVADWEREIDKAA